MLKKNVIAQRDASKFTEKKQIKQGGEISKYIKNMLRKGHVPWGQATIC